jgi:hypothetical protein
MAKRKTQLTDENPGGLQKVADLPLLLKQAEQYLRETQQRRLAAKLEELRNLKLRGANQSLENEAHQLGVEYASPTVSYKIRDFLTRRQERRLVRQRQEILRLERLLKAKRKIKDLQIEEEFLKERLAKEA